nr:54s ribosomal protein l27, mitochondrial [Quercus suber]
MHPSPALQRALRRLPLTTKQGPHNFYKGNRTGSMGEHTKYGGYKIHYEKVRTYVVPNLSESGLSPFVDKRIKRVLDVQPNMTGKEYLDLWKMDDEGDDVAMVCKTARHHPSIPSSSFVLPVFLRKHSDMKEELA